MKFLIKQTKENVRAYQTIGNKGVQVLDTVDSLEDLYNKVQTLEDDDFYPQEDGIVLNAAGNEVFDPNYPNDFDFVDYKYYMVDQEDLDDYKDAHILNVIAAY
jgi:hypothetical protein